MSRTYEKLRRQSGLHMSADGGDPFDSLPAAIAADVLGRVADGADIAACRLASQAFLAASYACSVSASAPPRSQGPLRRPRRRGGAAPAAPPSERPPGTPRPSSGRTSAPSSSTRPRGGATRTTRRGWRRGSSTRAATSTSRPGRPWWRGRTPPPATLSGRWTSPTTGRSRAGGRRRRFLSSPTSVILSYLCIFLLLVSCSLL